MKREDLNFYNMFWLFMFGCICGWIFELIFTLVVKGKLVNHSAFVIGPFNVVYGICACCLTFLLYRYRNKNIISLYLIGFIGGTILEYLLSFSFELFLHFKPWNYNNMFLNINGRVCLTMSSIWGLMGVVWIKYIYPTVAKLIKKIKPPVGNKLIVFLIIFMFFDWTLTNIAISRAKKWEKGIEPANNFEKFLDNTFNRDYLKEMYNDNWYVEGDK